MKHTAKRIEKVARLKSERKRLWASDGGNWRKNARLVRLHDEIERLEKLIGRASADNLTFAFMEVAA